MKRWRRKRRQRRVDSQAEVFVGSVRVEPELIGALLDAIAVLVERLRERLCPRG